MRLLDVFGKVFGRCLEGKACKNLKVFLHRTRRIDFLEQKIRNSRNYGVKREDLELFSFSSVFPSKSSQNTSNMIPK